MLRGEEVEPQPIVRTTVDVMTLALAADRPEPAAILLDPDARARYLRVDEAIGAIRRNGGSKLAFPGIQNYAGLI